jgi:hypothetical protein
MCFGDIVECQDAVSEFGEKVGAEGYKRPERKLQTKVRRWSCLANLLSSTYDRHELVLDLLRDWREAEEERGVDLFMSAGRVG